MMVTSYGSVHSKKQSSLASDQLDAQIFNTFITVLLAYMFCLFCITNFDFSLSMHLSITLANDQLDAQIFNTFITILY